MQLVQGHIGGAAGREVLRVGVGHMHGEIAAGRKAKRLLAAEAVALQEKRGLLERLALGCQRDADRVGSQVADAEVLDLEQGRLQSRIEGRALHCALVAVDVPVKLCPAKNLLHNRLYTRDSDATASDLNKGQV